MERYDVIIRPIAKASMNNIADYIADYIMAVLKAPEAADDTVRTIRKAILSLDFMPQRYAVLPEDFLEKEGVRRMQVRNYFVYFTVNEENKLVNILDVMYVGRDQRERLEAEEE